MTYATPRAKGCFAATAKHDHFGLTADIFANATPTTSCHF